MRRLALIALVSLAGCGGESTRESAARTGEIDVSNASVEEVAAQTKAAGAQMRFDPGQWRTTIEVIEAEVPGLPPQMAEVMKKQMLQKSTVSSCMTPEQAANPNEDLFAGKSGNCRFDRFTMKDGKVDAAMTCAGDGSGAGAAKILMTGTFDKTRFEMENRIEATGAGARQAMKMRSRVTGERTGDCA
ncbi:DUF3617 domain-containing protein [Sphingomonas spermidinifaciens]|uniref:DUF3617 domain-containing protein n=1 Tax=Sphingomonas spermidinifaciens TaxID=1141889 RepID=UPI001596E759|nr:DUF3617 domain-containing protein [Sphingomonas spermidinifaciens]